MSQHNGCAEKDLQKNKVEGRDSLPDFSRWPISDDATSSAMGTPGTNNTIIATKI